MDILALLDVLRANYLREYEAAYYQQVEINEQVFPEIAVEISGVTYKRLFVIDLTGRNRADLSAIEVGVSRAAYEGGISLKHNRLSIKFGIVAWDSMRFTLQAAPADLAGFEQWFDKWIDLEGTRHVDGNITSGVIHSSRIETGLVEMDFGSAPVTSAVELFDLFEMNGVNTIIVSSSRE